MKNIVKGYSSFMAVLEKIFYALMILFMLAMTVIMTYQVVLRFVFTSGNNWAEELTRIIFAFLVLFGSGIAIRHNSHLRVDFILKSMSPKVSAAYEIFLQAICFVFLIYVLKLSVALATSVRGTSAALGIPYRYSYLCLPIGAIYMMLNNIEQILLRINFLFGGQTSQTEVNKGGESR